jgi:hypothetical protein
MIGKRAKIIIVSKCRGLWWEEWKHTPEAESVKLVHGSTFIPAPFVSDLVPARVVCRQVAKLNPGYAVVAEAE